MRELSVDASFPLLESNICDLEKLATKYFKYHPFPQTPVENFPQWNSKMKLCQHFRKKNSARRLKVINSNVKFTVTV